MTSRADEVRERIVDLSELITAARESLADLGQDTQPYANLRRANLQATIETVRRELSRAMMALEQARGLHAAAEILAKVKTQAREARRAAKLAQTPAQAQRALDRAFAKDAAEAILASATAKAKERKARVKKKGTRYRR